MLQLNASVPLELAFFLFTKAGNALSLRTNEISSFAIQPAQQLAVPVWGMESMRFIFLHYWIFLSLRNLLVVVPLNYLYYNLFQRDLHTDVCKKSYTHTHYN